MSAQEQRTAPQSTALAWIDAIDPLTPAEAEYEALDAAADDLRSAWSGIIRAGHHDTRDVPAEYARAVRTVRAALECVHDMADARKGVA